jgi:hypothetical protein
VLTGVIIFITVMVFMAIVYYVVRMPTPRRNHTRILRVRRRALDRSLPRQNTRIERTPIALANSSRNAPVLWGEAPLPHAI